MINAGDIVRESPGCGASEGENDAEAERREQGRDLWETFLFKVWV